MPLGRYTLVADYVLDTTASGICNAHAVADFSPDTTLPAEWVRMRDPFQGVSKRSFGFTFSVAAGAPSTRLSMTGESRGQARKGGTRSAARRLVNRFPICDRGVCSCDSLSVEPGPQAGRRFP